MSQSQQKASEEQQQLKKQKTSELPNVTIIDLILFDHQKCRRLYQEFQNTTVPELQQTLCWELIREICVHTFKEEMVLYPVMAELVSKDDSKHCLEEHQQVKNMLESIDKMTADDPSFVDKVNEMMKPLIQHMEEEEKECLPKMKEKVKDPNYLKELAIAFDSATKNAPTRPHPKEPNTPPKNLKRNYELMIDDMKMDKERFEGSALLNVPMPPEAAAPQAVA